jgi:GTP-binding protein
MSKIISLIGRPNVGKSTLFNRMSVNIKAIVHDLAGVTRDLKYANAQIGGLEFTIVDTPGLENAKTDKLEYRMMQQTLKAIEESDILFFIVDGKTSVTTEDKIFADLLRKQEKPVILVVNKCEGNFSFSKDYYKLGFKNMIAISAEHGIGIMDIYESIAPYFEEDEEYHIDDGGKVNHVQIVIAGRPNAGKSTFINAILNEERLLTGPEAGITRESIEIDFHHNGSKMKLIDTAGLRRKSLVTKSLEKLSTSDTISTIQYANVVILMIDATAPLEQQDLNIASHVVREGRAIILVINKWDLVKDKENFKKELEYNVETNLSQIKGVPILYISALHKQNIKQVLDETIKIYEIWNKRISTSKLNAWLAVVTEDHPLPLQKGGKRVRVKYITQIKSRPPTFKLFANNPEKITDNYTKYLVNNLRENFIMPGVPIRFYYEKNHNPYVK